MNHPLGRGWFARLAFGVAATLLLAVLGCVHPRSRGQAEEDAEEKKDLDIRIVRDVTSVGNVGPLPISGVGLVTGLNGTGGSPPAGNDFRKLLETDLLKKRVPKVKELLESPDNALVLVS